MNLKRMEEQLLMHEGLRVVPYKDTEGYWTVGIGYNLSARGLEALERIIGRAVSIHSHPGRPYYGLRLTECETRMLLRADITRIEKSVRLYLPEYHKLGDVRQRVIVDMAFNMGRRLIQFKKAIKYLRHSTLSGRWTPNWSGVARELYNSRWAYQVDDGPGGQFGRADRLVKMMLTGEDYTV